MRGTLLLCALTMLCGTLAAQRTPVVYTIPADSVKLTYCDSTELIIENHTQNVPGFLFNNGNGRTIFKRAALKLNDSMYLIGADTVKTSSHAWQQGGNAFGATGVLGTLDNNHLDLYTNNTQQARLTGTGNLLLGTTLDQGYKLQVNGRAFSNGGVLIQNEGSLNNTQNGLVVTSTTPSNYAGVDLYNDQSSLGQMFCTGSNYPGFSNIAKQSFGLYTNSPGGMVFVAEDPANAVIRFSNGSPASATEKMQLSASGNLLLGTTTDNGYKMRLHGNAWVDSGGRVAFGDREIAIGELAASSYEGIAVGWNASAMFSGATAIGKNTVAGAQDVIHIGYYPSQASETVPNTVRIGLNYVNYLRLHDRQTALGAGANTTTNIEGATALGYNASALGQYSIALGTWSVAENAGDFVAGAGNFIGGEKPITNVYFGSGRDRNLAGTKFAGPGIAYAINGSGAWGTDNTGGDITVAGGKGTGAGAAGNVIFSVASTHGSDTVLQTLHECGRFAGITGNFGLGTTSPTAQLHTTGTVRFAGLTGDNTQTRVLVSDANGNLYYRDATTLAANDPLRSSLAVNWPDYVFAPDYQLPSLAEVEAYIQREHHLPGVPSAGEIRKKGVDAVAIQTTLLKKIEELTLYTIDQDKQLTAQRTEIADLKARLEKLEQLITKKEN